MDLKNFNYILPEELIAQTSAKPRDHSRLMILNKKKQSISHDFFFNLKNYLPKNSILVANNSRVLPARLYGTKPTGGKIEVLLLKKFKGNAWQVMIGGKASLGMQISFNKNLKATILKKEHQLGIMKFNQTTKNFLKILDKLGQAPTPPYIKRISNLREYQTIYAKKIGSVAAPTAGFHFTKKLIKNLEKNGFQFSFITLHVGLGTFQPVSEKKIENHRIHPEKVQVSLKTAKILNKAKKQNQKIIAIGTTSGRALESFVKNKKLLYGKKETKIFIYPGYKFKFIDGLITNFHLPKSTLLMMVSALAGQSLVQKAYRQAIKKKYRFYSFGDAMLII
jgi:S-adenosylmethionine:tRNA ribosyltransferase-isomerase